jgi:hypothetical protein
MASLLGGGSMREGGIPPGMVEFVSTRKTWAVSGLLLSGRVGSIDNDIRSTTWVAFSKGRMGLMGGKGSTDWVALSNGRVVSIEYGIRSTTGVTLSNGRVG